MSKKKIPHGQLSWLEKPADQLSWLDIVEPPQPPAIPFEMSINIESEAEFELRRIGEMAEKLGWPTLVIDPINTWPGLSIPAGEEAWCEFLNQTTCGIGLVMLALHHRLNPLTPGCIDENGLHLYPVEVISRIEGQLQSEMIQMAEYLEWPRLTYWDVNRTQVFGPGEAEWRRYFVYGSLSFFSTAVDALKRRLRGEPDRVKQASHQQISEEDDEEQ